MATITIPKNLFEKEIGKLDKSMQDKIILFGTPIENLNSEELQLEIFPDRPDMISYQGFKRAFLQFMNKKPGLKKYKLNPPAKDFTVQVDSSVKNIRPYTVCAIVKGIKLEDHKIKELIEIQEKLHITMGRKRKKLAIGIYPLEKIKMPITYKALEPDKIKFLPLESPREMSGLEILQKHPTGKEYAHLLAGKTKFPIFIDSNKNILSMPPLINSELTGKITEKTKDIFIECSGHNLEILNKCLNIVVTCLAEMGGTIYQMEIKGSQDMITPNLSTEKINISLEKTNKLLGIELNEKQLKILLEKMGYEYNNGQVKIPAWRTDILHEVDLIEDVAIAYGYENLIPEIPYISSIAKENPIEIKKRKISEILAGLNFLEVSNYHLTTKEEQFTKMQLTNPKEIIEIKESKTEYNLLRDNLTHYLLKILSENIDAEYPQKIFEIGKTFETNLQEKEKLSLAITPGNFTETKQTLEYLFNMLNLKIEIKEPKENKNWFIEGRSGDILLENKKIGEIGEIHPKILKNWKIKMPVALLEINLDFLN